MKAEFHIGRWAFLATMLAVAGCTPPIGTEVVKQVDASHHVVPVFYATDRSYDGAAPPAQRYGSGRGDMSYGIVEVSIPRDHQTGMLETPSPWHAEFHADPDRHVLVLSVSRDSGADFFAKLRETLARSPGKDAFVFIHGYNTTFEDAARRTAQLAYDLRFPGVPILYSWPSQGEVIKYVVDTNNADWTVAHLETFLADVAARSGASTIHLIGHSLGNRILLAALEGYARRVSAKKAAPFTDVLLTAPDVDAAIFRQHVSRVLASARHFTMYASSNDVALYASETLAEFPRAGDTRDGIVVVDGIDTIDASAVDTSLVGHSYFADNASVLADIDDILRRHAAPDQRPHLRAIDAQAGRYWIFTPAP
jgi:esterase/lipase superfamily enzyme